MAALASEWVRFTVAEPPMLLEAALLVQAVPSAPATWTLSLVDQVGGLGGRGVLGRQGAGVHCVQGISRCRVHQDEGQGCG